MDIEKEVQRRAEALRPGRRFWKSLLVAITLVATLLWLWDWSRPSLLLVGNITVDIVEGKQAVGGAVSYAAAVARAYGIRACVVTAASEDADLSVFRGHEVHRVASNATLTFEHTYTWWGNKRKLRVLAQPNVTLSMWRGVEHVPNHCLRARVILLGPLMPEDIDITSFSVSHTPGLLDQLLGAWPKVGLMAQGLQRSLDAFQRVVALKAPSRELLTGLAPDTSVFLSDVETDVWPPGTVEKLSMKSARWLVTRGEAGADEITAGKLTVLPPVKVKAVDTNGAGDTFATAYMLALAARSRDPGAEANWAASRAVMQPQSCKPDCVEASIRAESRWARLSAWLHGKGAWCAECLQRALDSQAGRAVASWAGLCSQQVQRVCHNAWKLARRWP